MENCSEYLENWISMDLKTFVSRQKNEFVVTVIKMKTDPFFQKNWILNHKNLN